MQSISSILSDILDSDVPCFALEEKTSEEVTKWWAWPSTKIDHTKLKEGMTELPVYRDGSSDGTPAYFDPGHALGHYAFRLNPDNPKKMLVMPIRDCEKIRIDTEDRTSWVYQYERPFEVTAGTPMQVVSMLMKHLGHRHTQTEERIRLDYGDVNTLKSWNETHDVEGYVGVTTGKLRAFILVHNKRSMGGSTILTDCILSIRTAKKEGNSGNYHYFYTLNEQFSNPLRKIEAAAS